MALPQSHMNRFTRARPESADPFAMQLALSQVHARLVPMQRDELGYAVDPCAEGWAELSASRGFAAYGLGRALRMLLDILRGLTALHDTFDAEGFNFAHGEVAPTQFRVDDEGVCRLVPLTTLHSGAATKPATEVLGYLAPERLLGEALDARADVFSAGVLLWEALAGRRLFNESNADAIIERLMGERLQMPQLPPELAWAIPLKSIVARALAVDPYQRFADCAELSTAIAIVARERVATHAEIATLFGSKTRSGNSVAQKRPVPTRSSTFPSVASPSSPPSISAPPSSRNGFPLATPASRSITPAPRSVAPAPRSTTPAPRSVAPAPRSTTPVPRSVAPAPRSTTPAPRSVAPAPRSTTPAPRSVAPAPRSGIPTPRAGTPVPLSVAPRSVAPAAPSSAPRGPESQRRVGHKSPFVTLLGTGEVIPTSQRRRTLMSVGTPAAALAPPAEVVPVSAANTPPSASLLPPLPLWAATVAGSAPPPPAKISSPAVAMRATLESIALSEVAKFRSWSSRRSLIVLTLVALFTAGIALVAIQSSGDAPESTASHNPSPAQPSTPRAIAPEPTVSEPAVLPDEHARTAPASASEPSNGSPAAAVKEPRPSKAAAPPSKPANANSSSASTKDYGI